jgi:hypothetical protein
MTITLSGDNAVRYARFASLKYQLKLEQAGMKSSGGALRPRLAKEFGLKARDGHASYIGYCIEEMAKCMDVRAAELAQGAVA